MECITIYKIYRRMCYRYQWSKASDQKAEESQTPTRKTGRKKKWKKVVEKTRKCDLLLKILNFN